MLKKLGDFLTRKVQSKKFKKGLQYSQAFGKLREEIAAELGLSKKEAKKLTFKPAQNKGLKVICPDRMWAQEIRLNSSSLLERLRDKEKKWEIDIDSLKVTTDNS